MESRKRKFEKIYSSSEGDYFSSDEESGISIFGEDVKKLETGLIGKKSKKRRLSHPVRVSPGVFKKTPTDCIPLIHTFLKDNRMKCVCKEWNERLKPWTNVYDYEGELLFIEPFENPYHPLFGYKCAKNMAKTNLRTFVGRAWRIWDHSIHSEENTKVLWNLFNSKTVNAQAIRSKTQSGRRDYLEVVFLGACYSGLFEIATGAIEYAVGLDGHCWAKALCYGMLGNHVGVVQMLLNRYMDFVDKYDKLEAEGYSDEEGENPFGWESSKKILFQKNFMYEEIYTALARCKCQEIQDMVISHKYFYDRDPRELERLGGWWDLTFRDQTVEALKCGNLPMVKHFYENEWFESIGELHKAFFQALKKGHWECCEYLYEHFHLGYDEKLEVLTHVLRGNCSSQILDSMFGDVLEQVRLVQKWKITSKSKIFNLALEKRCVAALVPMAMYMDPPANLELTLHLLDIAHEKHSGALLRCVKVRWPQGHTRPDNLLDGCIKSAHDGGWLHL